MARNGQGNHGAGSGRVTSACAREEPVEYPELSSDNSPYNLTASTKGSTDVSFTDSNRVERVDMNEEADSEKSEGVLKSSMGNGPMPASIDLQ